MAESAVAAVAAASGDKSCGVESQRADATQGSSVVNDTLNHLHIGEFVKRKNESVVNDTLNYLHIVEEKKMKLEKLEKEK